MRRYSSGVSPPRFNHRQYAELHLHLGGAIMPRILHAHLVKTRDALLARFPEYEGFEDFFRRPRGNLTAFLELHKVTEKIQKPAAIGKFIEYLVRGAYLFEDLAYIELRHCPWLRTDAALSEAERIEQMRRIVLDIAAAAERRPEYPIVLTQILCMHTALPQAVNERILELAVEMRPTVCAIDIAGPDLLYDGRVGEFCDLLARARESELKVTAHCFETPAGCYPELLPLLDRVGHGVQIPLLRPELLDGVRERGQVLEVCPTSYLKTGTMRHYAELRPVIERCDKEGVDVTICTDNSGIHMLRLPNEYENLLIHEVITVAQMKRMVNVAYKHAFAWPFAKPAGEMAVAGRAV